MRKLALILLAFSLTMTLSAEDYSELTSEDLFRDERVTVSEPSTKIQRSISKFDATITQKKAEIQQARSEIRSAPTYIEDIEYLKGALQEIQAQSDELSTNKYEGDMEVEISTRMSRQARIAELDGDGLTLNANGRKSIENDVEAIRKKYEDLFNEEKTAVAKRSGPKTESIKGKIKELLEVLSISKFEASSMSNEGLTLTFGSFSGKTGSEGWPYRATFTANGNKVLEYTGLLLYSEISGKSVPSPAKVGDSNYEAKNNEYSTYLDAVDIFDALLKSNSFVEAVLSYTVTPSSNALEYKFHASSLKFNNVLTGKTFKTLNKTDTFTYRPQPEIAVEFAGTVPEKDIPAPVPVPEVPKIATPELRPDPAPARDISMDDSDIFNPFAQEEKIVETQPVVKEEEKKIVETEPEKKPAIRITIQAGAKNQDESSSSSQSLGPSIRTKNPDATKPEEKSKPKKKITNVPSVLDGGKSTYAAVLYFLPGTYNFYSRDGKVTMTAGYALDFSILNHFYAGFKIETAILGLDTTKSKPYNGESDSIAFFDEGNPLVFTGTVGTNFNLSKNARLDIFGEGGLMFGEICVGAGVSLEILNPSTESGLFIGYTALTTESEKFYNKFSIGFEQTF